ncbi:unnamed protein product [Haemonchus placei]|uniref:Uncharacterized protein n=1 Tax=Haemonchus placei TaxID=6290 RepID=A0A3P7YN64_HAEPC|nr:unnamed protein product [Haemonchus placei]
MRRSIDFRFIFQEPMNSTERLWKCTVENRLMIRPVHY